MRNFSVLVIVSCLFGTIVSAQSTEIGLMAGTSTYNGDLSRNGFQSYIEHLHPAAGVFARIGINRQVSLRLAASYARVSGEEDLARNAEYARNFRTDIKELALTAEVNLWRLGRPGRSEIIPYLYGGAAIYQFNPETQFENQWIDLQPLGTEGQGLEGYPGRYELTQWAIPVGGGIKIDWPRWTLGFELGGRKLFTDHLDDISAQVVNYQDVLDGNGVLAATISNPAIGRTTGEESITYKRGGRFNDWYYLANVTVGIKLQGNGRGYSRKRGGKFGCPNFTR